MVWGDAQPYMYGGQGNLTCVEGRGSGQLIIVVKASLKHTHMDSLTHPPTHPPFYPSTHLSIFVSLDVNMGMGGWVDEWVGGTHCRPVPVVLLILTLHVHHWTETSCFHVVLSYPPSTTPRIS